VIFESLDSWKWEVFILTISRHPSLRI